MRGWIGEVQVVLLGIVFLGIVFLERFIAAPSRSPRQVRSQLPSLYSATFGWIAGAWGGFYRLPWLSLFFKVLLCRQCCRQEGGFLAAIFAKVVDLPGKINSVKAIGLECGLDEATQTLLYYFCPRANLPYTIEGFLSSKKKSCFWELCFRKRIEYLTTC